MKITKLNVYSFAILQAKLAALLGFLAGILYSFGGFFVDTFVTLGWVTTHETPGLSYGTVLAFGALIGMPLIFTVFGILLGIVEAVLFNLFGKWIGSIDIDFE